ncbi:unnamed protein product [Choristocarpus tenellus]
MGSFLDLDHFAAAGSFRLSQALGLSARPWGHSTSAKLLIVSVCSVSYAMVLWGLTLNTRAAFATISSGASHQLRDSTRRGLWLWPPDGPSTAPVPYLVYILAQGILPLVLAVGLNCMGDKGGYIISHTLERSAPLHIRGLPLSHCKQRLRMMLGSLPIKLYTDLV